MARFAQYAMVASDEALKDSGWLPKKEEDLEITVRQLNIATNARLIVLRECTWVLVSVVSMTCMIPQWLLKKE